MPYGYNSYVWRGQEDLENYLCWVCNVAHTSPSWKPLWTELWYDNVPHSMKWGGETYSLPRSKGWDWRIHNGHGYITPTTVSEPHEIQEREKLYRERIETIIEDPWAHWENLKEELCSIYANFIPLNVEDMSNIELCTHFLALTGDMLRRLWEIHMDGWYSLCGSGFGLFRNQVWPDLTGLPPSDVKFSKVLGGFDNALFKLNKRVADLANVAMELGVDGDFDLSDEQVIPALEQSEAGRKWVEALEQFLYGGITPFDRFGHRMDRMLECSNPTWIEKPSLAIPHVRRSIASGGIHAPDEERASLRAEGEEIEKEILSKAPADRRDAFKKLLNAAQATQHYSEDHDYWCEFQYFSLIRRATIEIGKRLAIAGVIDDPEDIYFLFRSEIDASCIVLNRINRRNEIESRKKEWQQYMSLELGSDAVPTFMGDPADLEEIVRVDPIFGVVMAVPVANAEEVGATCVGAASAPGVVEGTARVISTPSEWEQLQAGEILVAPGTDASWTPLFGVISGVVTDSGGTLAHAAIVGREYGIPAVVGTQDATKKIKTGQKIRIDGNMNRVYILE